MIFLKYVLFLVVLYPFLDVVSLFENTRATQSYLQNLENPRCSVTFSLEFLKSALFIVNFYQNYNNFFKHFVRSKNTIPKTNYLQNNSNIEHLKKMFFLLLNLAHTSLFDFIFI